VAQLAILAGGLIVLPQHDLGDKPQRQRVHAIGAKGLKYPAPAAPMVSMMNSRSRWRFHMPHSSFPQSGGTLINDTEEY
jgi:hypothetical protein